MNARFCWIVYIKRNLVLSKSISGNPPHFFFDPDMPTWIFVDAALAVIVQGEDIEGTNAVAFASRTTTPVEKHYSQIDLEAMAIDFGSRRLINYCFGGKDICVEV